MCTDVVHWFSLLLTFRYVTVQQFSYLFFSWWTFGSLLVFWLVHLFLIHVPCCTWVKVELLNKLLISWTSWKMQFAFLWISGGFEIERMYCKSVVWKFSINFSNFSRKNSSNYLKIVDLFRKVRKWGILDYLNMFIHGYRSIDMR